MFQVAAAMISTY